MISENRLHDILHSVPMNNLEFIPTVFSKDCLLKPKRINIFFLFQNGKTYYSLPMKMVGFIIFQMAVEIFINVCYAAYFFFQYQL